MAPTVKGLSCEVIVWLLVFSSLVPAVEAYDAGDALALLLCTVLTVVGFCACLGWYARRRDGPLWTQMIPNNFNLFSPRSASNLPVHASPACIPRIFWRRFCSERCLIGYVFPNIHRGNHVKPRKGGRKHPGSLRTQCCWLRTKHCCLAYIKDFWCFLLKTLFVFFLKCF